MENYPDDWNQRRSKVYKRNNFECQNCGRKGGPRGDSELHCHHIVPKSSGGSHELSNLITVCAQCHNAIHGNAKAPNARKTTSNKFLEHLVVFIFFGWWTLGIANLVYELLRESGDPKVGDDGRERLGKRDRKKGHWQGRVDKGRNQRYGGCPACEAPDSLTVSWIKLDDGSKAKVIECTECPAQYDETKKGLRKIDSVEELNSGRSAVMQELFG